MQPPVEATELAILSTMVKRRRESIDMFRKGACEEQAAKEEARRPDGRGDRFRDSGRHRPDGRDDVKADEICDEGCAGYAGIPVAGMAEAIAYYEGKLGFDIVMKMPEGDYAIVERYYVALQLFHVASSKHSPVSFHIFANAIDELFSELESEGAEVLQGIVQ